MRPVSLLLNLACVLILVDVCGCFERCAKIDDCTCRTEKGDINLRSVSRLSAVGHDSNGSIPTLQYTWSPCVPWTLNQTMENNQCVNVSMCRVDRSPFGMLEMNIGEHQTMQCSVDRTTGLCLIQYGVRNNPRVHSNILLQCSDGTKSYIDAVTTSYDQNIFHTTLYSKCACPGKCPLKSNGLRVWLIIVIVVAGFIALYFICGIAFNKFVRGKQGKKVFPHWSFWVWLVNQTKNCCTHLFCCCLAKGHDYERI